MNIEEKQLKDELYISVVGRIDTNSAPILEKYIKDNFFNVPIVIRHKLTLDLSKTEYMSSSGVRVIIETFKLIRAGAAKKLAFVIKNPSDFCYQVLETVGVLDFLTVERG